MSEGEKPVSPNNEPYDYKRLLRRGQRWVGPSTIEERFNASQDQAPRVKESVVRKVNGQEKSVPVVTQIGFDENLNEVHVKQTMSTSSGKRELKPITPIEEDQITRSLHGYTDPEIAKKAQRQRAAIRASQKNKQPKKAIEVPTEGYLE